MGAVKHFSQLVVWQLADELRKAVFVLTSTAAFSRD